MKQIAPVLLLCFVISCASFPSQSRAEDPFRPDYLLSDEDMTDVSAMSKDELAGFLRRGALGSYITIDLDGTARSATDIVWNASQEFSINPKVLLVLLQREQSLVEDDAPTQDQLDWAMGYAVCDSCDKNDPGLQTYRGFAKQVHEAAKRIRESYLSDLKQDGQTLSGVGPGIPATIDGVQFIPTNAATSVLYTYTPHLHGNQNFVRIWNTWFLPNYPNGSLLKDQATGSVWLIQNGLRRAVATRAVFQSRFDASRLISVNQSVLDSFDTGVPISYPNYSLLRQTDGTVYLLVNDTIRKIASQEVFRAIGFNPDDVVDISNDDLAAFTPGTDITTNTSSPQSTLIQDKTTGGVFSMEDGVKHPIMSRELLAARFPNVAIVPVSPEQLSSYQTGAPVTFPDGTLIAVHGSPDVFVVSEGKRLHIVDESAFLAYGWRWNQIVWTNERSVLIHPLGDDIRLPEITPDLSTSL